MIGRDGMFYESAAFQYDLFHPVKEFLPFKQYINILKIKFV